MLEAPPDGVEQWGRAPSLPVGRVRDQGAFCSHWCEPAPHVRSSGRLSSPLGPKTFRGPEGHKEEKRGRRVDTPDPGTQLLGKHNPKWYCNKSTCVGSFCTFTGMVTAQGERETSRRQKGRPHAEDPTGDIATCLTGRPDWVPAVDSSTLVRAALQRQPMNGGRN
ncbi:hypothetical protein NDU88_002612 [Pleurodeles waltl]|uniref:Uncharacterized protein n=1 Tax=Pleurodeles waltl TaxID=8319 RepID=A0AAV7W2V8_PLEWA|nr:hypothetical protein NDU88_002612 [Pleurodeles waltl]